jgi:Ca2+-binding EF-hand superfamily protein
MEEVLRELRQTLHLKRVSFYDMFNQLDQNKDGFITIEEFDKIDKWVKFEQAVKDGLFAFIDKGKIGMIDYATFL